MSLYWKYEILGSTSLVGDTVYFYVHAHFDFWRDKFLSLTHNLCFFDSLIPNILRICLRLRCAKEALIQYNENLEIVKSQGSYIRNDQNLFSFFSFVSEKLIDILSLLLGYAWQIVQKYLLKGMQKCMVHWLIKFMECIVFIHSSNKNSNTNLKFKGLEPITHIKSLEIS